MGLLLFLCYINDLPSCVSSIPHLLADDCLLYRRINSPADAVILQQDVDGLQKWESDWLMQFNPDKCEVIRITNRRGRRIVSDGSVLREVSNAKCLGVTIDSKLTWNAHVANVSKKANNTRAFLHRNINRCPANIKETCYKTFVRFSVEYASCVWDPPTAKNISAVEKVSDVPPVLLILGNIDAPPLFPP